jgi:hypothetical protein
MADRSLFVGGDEPPDMRRRVSLSEIGRTSGLALALLSEECQRYSGKVRDREFRHHTGRNVLRLGAWFAGTARAKPHRSPFARLLRAGIAA